MIVVTYFVILWSLLSHNFFINKDWIMKKINLVNLKKINENSKNCIKNLEKPYFFHLSIALRIQSLH